MPRPSLDDANLSLPLRDLDAASLSLPLQSLEDVWQSQSVPLPDWGDVRQSRLVLQAA